MKVSVIIPAYNCEKYISRAIESVINQVYKNIEIIIIDDASTDNTKNIIKKYAEKDNRIIPFYSTINKGVSASRNIGLKACTGDYIMFIDSDDEITRDAIRRMIDVALKYNSDYVDSYHLLYYKKKNGKIVSFTEHKLPNNNLVLGSLNDNIKILNLYTYVTGKLIKKELLDNLFFDEDLRTYEDLVFEHELKIRIKNYVLINNTIYLYYQVENSLINTLGKKHLVYLDAAKKVKDIYTSYNKEIRDSIEAILFQNVILTLFTKVIKNDDSISENTKLVTNAMRELIDTFPNYEKNKKISKIIKNRVKLYLNDENKLYKFIRKMQKIDTINLYFIFLSIVNKHEIKKMLI